MQKHFLHRKLRQFHFILKRIQAHRSGKKSLSGDTLQQLYRKAKLLFKRVKSQLSFTDFKKVAGVLGMAFLMAQSPLQSQTFAPPEITPFGLDVINGEEVFFNFVDIDGDGDLDLFGTETIYGNYGLDNVKYRLCENIGTPDAPQFATLVDFTEQEGVRAAKFADLDGDGDFDAISMITNYDSDSELFSLGYAENVGSPTSAEFAEGQDSNPFGLSFSDYTYQFFFEATDMDNDGDLDMVVAGYSYDSNGEEVSNLQYFENTGSATSAAFDGGNPNDIGLELPMDTYYTFLSTADLDNDGDVDLLLVGVYYDYDSETYGNRIYFAENTGTSSSPQFTSTPVENTFGLTIEGIVSDIVIPLTEDIDNDGDEDVFFWGYDEASGGYKMIYQENVTTISVKETYLELNLTPNPASDLVFFSDDMNVETVRITDLTGKIIEQQRAVNQSISVQSLPSGMYILHCSLKDGQTAIARVVKE